MQITRHEDYILVDDYLDNETLQKVMSEVLSLSHLAWNSKLARNGIDISAIKDVVILSLDDQYGINRNQSDILEMFNKFWSDHIKVILKDAALIFQILPYMQKDTTELQYYGNAGFYQEHEDDMSKGEFIVADLLLCKEPKKFEGGELIMNDHIIEHKNNRLVIFPAFLRHRVNTIKTESKDRVDGRISLQNRSWI